MSHWAAQYIGMPWGAGAQGPDAWDCWSFFRHVQAAHFGVDVAVIGIDADDMLAVMRTFRDSPERLHWLIVPHDPAPGDAVLMSHARYPSHVGVWLDADGGGVLHCVRGAGVLFSSLAALRRTGWGRLAMYRHVSRVDMVDAQRAAR